MNAARQRLKAARLPHPVQPRDPFSKPQPLLCAASFSKLSPGLTMVNCTGSSAMSSTAAALARHGEGRGGEVAFAREVLAESARRGCSRA